MIRQHRFFMFMILTFLVFSRAVFAQTNLDKIIGPLNHWLETQPQERVYLHTDKPYYVAGDTLWLKAYAVIGSQNLFSALSGALYVDLINESDSLVTALKLPLMSGMAKGNIDLPADLEQGNYRLRAYTQWMRNAGPDYFYDHSFIIGSISKGLTNPEISFRYEKNKNDGALQTTITYTDLSNNPIINREVNYLVQSTSSLVKKGKGKTDESGKIAFLLNPPEDFDSVNTHIISLIELEKNKWEKYTFPVKSRFKEADIQFFPEGGDLVVGLPSRVGFKAIGQDGLGIEVSGKILDHNQTEILSFSSMHEGMGVFNFTPEKDIHYQAELTFPDGSKNLFELSHILEEGYVIAVYPEVERDSIMVKIFSSASLYSPVSLVVQQGGQLLYAADFTISRVLTNLVIPTIDFASGVVQFTLFNDNRDPVNERVVFVEQPDQLELQVDLDNENYAPNSHMSFMLNAKDVQGKPAIGNFSIAILDETQVPVDENTENSILAQLLLRSELKGYIENPTYYFTEVDNEKRDHLDLLMMTQGYRRFSWKELINEESTLPEFPPEKLTSTISGKLLNLFGKPVDGGRITLMSLAANVILDTITNSEGYFEFNNLLLTDSIKFTVQGRSAKNSDKVEIFLDGIPGMTMTINKNKGDLNLNIPASIHQYLDHSLMKDETLSKLGLNSRVIQLDEVNVTGNRRRSTSSNLNGFGRADQVIAANELSTCPTLRMCLEGRLHGVRFQTEQTSIGPVSFPVSIRGSGKLLISIDGRILRPDQESDLMDIVGLFEQNMIDPASIRNIELVKSPSLTSTYGADAQNGVIIINTNGWVPSTRTDFSIKTYAPKGFSQVREFYSPQHSVTPGLGSIPDLRTTIYWNPTLTTDENGQANVSFFNSSLPADYRILIEGISNEGKIGRKIVHYQVSD